MSKLNWVNVLANVLHLFELEVKLNAIVKLKCLHLFELDVKLNASVKLKCAGIVIWPSCHRKHEPPHLFQVESFVASRSSRIQDYFRETNCV